MAKLLTHLWLSQASHSSQLRALRIKVSSSNHEKLCQVEQVLCSVKLLIKNGITGKLNQIYGSNVEIVDQ